MKLVEIPVAGKSIEGIGIEIGAPHYPYTSKYAKVPRCIYAARNRWCRSCNKLSRPVLPCPETRQKRLLFAFPTRSIVLWILTRVPDYVTMETAWVGGLFTVFRKSLAERILPKELGWSRPSFSITDGNE